MGNPVWKVGFEAGKKYMGKIATYIGIGGVVGATSAYYFGKAKGREEALSVLDDRDILNIPEGCRACGGPYPSCISSCSMFDK